MWTSERLQRNASLGAGYAVSLPAFQGPLDLLLHLIEQQALDIGIISLVAVTDQYLRTIEQLQGVEAGALADFLVVASRLLYLKSSSLLPNLARDDEEEEDTGDALVRQLLEYHRFKQAAASFRMREDARLRVFPRPVSAPETDGRLSRTPDLSNVDLPTLQDILRRALKRIPIEAPLPRVHPYAVTVADQIEVVRRALLRARDAALSDHYGVSFGDLLGQAYSRLELIVTFLAVLELLKQEEIQAVQEETFGDILLFPASMLRERHD